MCICGIVRVRGEKKINTVYGKLIRRSDSFQRRSSAARNQTNSNKQVDWSPDLRKGKTSKRAGGGWKAGDLHERAEPLVPYGSHTGKEEFGPDLRPEARDISRQPEPVLPHHSRFWGSEENSKRPTSTFE